MTITLLTIGNGTESELCCKLYEWPELSFSEELLSKASKSFITCLTNVSMVWLFSARAFTTYTRRTARMARIESRLKAHALATQVPTRTRELRRRMPSLPSLLSHSSQTHRKSSKPPHKLPSPLVLIGLR
jgi:hypothetical protein